MLEVFRINHKDNLFLEVRNIRREVFVEGQGVSISDEYDNFEIYAQHYLVAKMGIYCAAARWRKTDLGIKLNVLQF